MNKDSIILVLKVGIKDLTVLEIEKRLSKIKKNFISDKDEVSWIIIPTQIDREMQIECINPKLISEEEYTKVSSLIAESEELLKKIKEVTLKLE